MDVIDIIGGNWQQAALDFYAAQDAAQLHVTRLMKASGGDVREGVIADEALDRQRAAYFDCIRPLWPLLVELIHAHEGWERVALAEAKQAG